MLALPIFSKPFNIETDASASGIGAVLTQDGHPLAFISKSLCPHSSGPSTYEKEYLAVIMAVQQWHQYLQFAEFTIFIDQQSLVQLTGQRLHTMWQQKLFTKLLGLQYRIVYKPGTSNRVADALSQKTFHDSSCVALSVVAPKWIQEVTDWYSRDPVSLEMIAKLSIDSQAVSRFSMRDGVLHLCNRIWIGSNIPLQQRLMEASHSSALGGHSGFPVTYMHMKQMFSWQGMKSVVRDFVSSCIPCQRAKPDRFRLPGLL